MPTLELHPLRSAMQFRLATFRYPIPVFDGATEVDEVDELADELAEAVTEIAAPGSWPQDDMTTTPQVPDGSRDEVPGATEETVVRKGGQAR
jgi:hypothetical protein